MKRAWPVWFLLAFSCARKPEPEARGPEPSALTAGRVEELGGEEVGETGVREPVVTDDPLFLRVEEVGNRAARMRAEGVTDRDAQARACIAEEDLLPAPDAAQLSPDESSRLKALSARTVTPERSRSIEALASASGSPAFRKEALRALARLLRRGDDAFEVILAVEKSAESLPRADLPNDLVPTLLGHAGLFHLHDARVRLAAARMLGKLAEPRAVPFLMRARASYEDEEFAREVEKALEACTSAASR